MLIWSGPEDVTQRPTTSALASALTPQCADDHAACSQAQNALPPAPDTKTEPGMCELQFLSWPTDSALCVNCEQECPLERSMSTSLESASMYHRHAMKSCYAVAPLPLQTPACAGLVAATGRDQWQRPDASRRVQQAAQPPCAHSQPSSTRRQKCHARAPGCKARGLLGCAAFLLALTAALAMLAILSDVSLRRWREHACLGWLPDARSAAAVLSAAVVAPLARAVPMLSPSVGWLLHAGEGMHQVVARQREVRLMLRLLLQHRSLGSLTQLLQSRRVPTVASATPECQ